mmetsp:Transcript_33645/g.85963  ORF Transcript_33645/g.85963 Transcript_33645/m.85963 type:complete len:210 (-) Transcript_33645:346-975(-)
MRRPSIGPRAGRARRRWAWRAGRSCRRCTRSCTCGRATRLARRCCSSASPRATSCCCRSRRWADKRSRSWWRSTWAGTPPSPRTRWGGTRTWRRSPAGWRLASSCLPARGRGRRRRRRAPSSGRTGRSGSGRWRSSRRAGAGTRWRWMTRCAPGRQGWAAAWASPLLASRAWASAAAISCPAASCHLAAVGLAGAACTWAPWTPAFPGA